MALPSLIELLALFTPIITATPLPPPIIGPVSLNIQALSAAGSAAVNKRHAFASLYRKTMHRRGKGFKTTRPYISGERITPEFIQALDNNTSRYYFGFTPAQILSLIDIMDIPDIVTQDRCIFPALEAFCLLLARFRSEGNMFTLTSIFNRAQSSISYCINKLLVEIDDRWHHLLEFDHEHLLCPAHLNEYAAAFRRKGSLLDHVWGVIDCTIRQICRPSVYQRQAYNGYKKYHALKYQAVVIPNGLIAHLFGPMEGRRADGGLLFESNLLETCEQYAIRPGTNANTPPEERYFWLYGDPAYGLSPVLLSPFSNPNADEQRWNARMSEVRIEVEHHQQKGKKTNLCNDV